MKGIFLIFVAALLSGCIAIVPTKGAGIYEPREHLASGLAHPGVVLDVRSVQIAPDQRVVSAGGALGATLGGLVGSNVGKGSGERAGALVGAVLGGIAGAGVAGHVTTAAHEIIVRLDSGRTVAVVQYGDQAFTPGQLVWIVGTGHNMRVVPRT